MARELTRVSLILVGVVFLTWAGIKILSTNAFDYLDLLLLVPAGFAFVLAVLANAAFLESVAGLTLADFIQITMLIVSILFFSISLILDDAEDKALSREWGERIFLILVGIQAAKILPERKTEK